MPSGWRIDKPGRKAFSGEGARLYGGRWNSPGVAVVYMSEHQSLAALEILVHQRPLTPHGKFLAFLASWEESQTERVLAKNLPRNWRASPAEPANLAIGDDWARSGRSLILAVPSAIVPAETNFLLNPAHPDLSQLQIAKPIAFNFDARLLGR